MLTGSALLLALASGAAGPPPAPLNPDTAAAVRDNNAFALDLYGRLRAADGNLFFSPHSLSTALAMTYAGARGGTAEELAAALHFTLGPNRLHPAFADLLRETHGTGKPRKYQLVTANRLWGQQAYDFLPEFLKLTQTHYGAGLREVDFADTTEEVRRTINAWVQEQTKDKIKDLLMPGVLSGDTRLVLTNAVYFKAAWRRPFPTKETKDGNFHAAGGKKVRVPLMRTGLTTRFFDGDTFQAVELPYENHDLSMLVFLPKKADGLAEFEKGLTAARLAEWLSKLSLHSVDVTLPRFKVAAQPDLNKVLSEMGVRQAFDPRRADFSGMTARERLFVSAVLHKAFVDVNEAGTEAAAATGMVFDAVSAPPPATFRADRPFVFLIRDNRTGSILFLGRVMNP